MRRGRHDYHYSDARIRKFFRNKRVQDAFIVLTAPLLMLVGMLITLFLSLH